MTYSHADATWASDGPVTLFRSTVWSETTGHKVTVQLGRMVDGEFVAVVPTAAENRDQLAAMETLTNADGSVTTELVWVSD